MFSKATKKKCKLRCAIFGPSGSGKTFSALRIAKGIGGKIAVIDTETGSASKYADRFEFDVCELEDRTIPGYVKAISSAKGYDVLLIDSLSHGWAELLQQVEKLAQAKFKGNTWSAWSEGTPLQRSLIDAILSFPSHILATMRSKTEWTTEQGNNGRSRPVRVGLTPEQGKGIEYEFDLLLELSTEHVANVIKDRTGKFQDALIDKPGEKFGQQLAAWLEEGVVSATPEAKPKIEPTDPPLPTPVQQTILGKVEEKLLDSVPEGMRLDLAKLYKLLYAAKGAYPEDETKVGAIAAWVASRIKDVCSASKNA
jgi:hypothetical protein